MTVSLLFHVVNPSMSVSHIYFSLIYTLIDFQISQERVNTSVHEQDGYPGRENTEGTVN